MNSYISLKQTMSTNSSRARRYVSYISQILFESCIMTVVYVYTIKLQLLEGKQNIKSIVQSKHEVVYNVSNCQSVELPI